MNCRDWEERIALYAGGDLTPAEAAEAERHLGDCPGCQVFASGLKESLGLLQTVHQDPLAEAVLAAVRARVLSELMAARQPWWRKVWVYAGAAAAAALVVMLAFRPGPPPPQRGAAIETPPAIAAAPCAEASVHRMPRRRVRRALVHAEPGPPIVVKLLTDDPDVVIYWITNKSGE